MKGRERKVLILWAQNMSLITPLFIEMLVVNEESGRISNYNVYQFKGIVQFLSIKFSKRFYKWNITIALNTVSKLNLKLSYKYWIVLK